MIVVSGTSNEEFAKKLAAKLDVKYVKSVIQHFPDGELHVKIPGAKVDKVGVVVQSLVYTPNEYLMEAILLADDLKREGAKKVVGVFPYLAYARQDEAFTKGEAVSFLSVAKLLESYFDRIITVDAHLHRFHDIRQVFKKAENVSAMAEISEYLRRKFKKFKDPIVLGPDEESEQWAKQIARGVGCEYDVFTKTRFSATRVEIHPKKADLTNREVIIVDDIISTGGTMINAVKIARREGAKRIIAVCSHGLLLKDSLLRIKKAGADYVISTNTVPNGKTSMIDATDPVAEALR